MTNLPFHHLISVNSTLCRPISWSTAVAKRINKSSQYQPGIQTRRLAPLIIIMASKRFPLVAAGPSSSARSAGDQYLRRYKRVITKSVPSNERLCMDRQFSNKRTTHSRTVHARLTVNPLFQIPIFCQLIIFFSLMPT